MQALAERAGGGTSPATVNHYVRSLRGFTRWLRKHKRVATDHLIEPLALLNEKVDIRRGRRGLTADELAQLLTAARESVTAFLGLTGPDRFALYLTANGHRLPGERPRRPHPDRLRPRRRPADGPVQQEPEGEGATAAGGRGGGVAGVSGRPAGWCPRVGRDRKAARMMRVDLEAAGIPYAVPRPDGPRYADFHALRHTYLTLLGRHGVDLRTAQELAGHSRPELTARYSHRLDDLAGAVGKLPALVPMAGVTGAEPLAPLLAPTPRGGAHSVARMCATGGEFTPAGAVSEPLEM